MTKKIRTLSLALLAFTALSAATAAIAQAGPKYSVCEEVTAGTGKFTDSACKKLGTGNFEKFLGASTETRAVEAAVSKTYVLETINGTKIKCTAQKLEAGATIIGGNPGTSSEKITFENCTLEGNGTPCEIEKKEIKTTPLTNTLDKANKTNTKGEILLVVFKPVKGALFAEFKITGTGCAPLGAGAYTVETKAGEGVAGEALEKEGKPVLLEQNEPLGLTGFVNFPKVKQTAVFIENASGVVEEVKLKLTAFGSNVKLFEGTSSIKVKNKAGTANVEWAVLK